MKINEQSAKEGVQSIYVSLLVGPIKITSKHLKNEGWLD